MREFGLTVSPRSTAARLPSLEHHDVCLRGSGQDIVRDACTGDSGADDDDVAGFGESGRRTQICDAIGGILPVG